MPRYYDIFLHTSWCVKHGKFKKRTKDGKLWGCPDCSREMDIKGSWLFPKIIVRPKEERHSLVGKRKIHPRRQKRGQSKPS